jgi:uncharacterized membrane protein YhaH (DUF805 family)
MVTGNPYQTPRAVVADALEEEYQEVSVLSASGRIGRARYIAWTMGITFIFYFAAMLLSVALAQISPTLGMIVMGIAAIAMLVIQLRLTIQRCHNFDMSGWLTLAIIVPLAVFAFWFIPGTDGENRWGAKTKANSTGVLVAAWLGALGIPILGIIAAIAIPQYQSYVKRAQEVQQRQHQQQQEQQR